MSQNSEYIIVNKTALLERIAELERQIKESTPEETVEHDFQCEDKIEELNMILSKSTPLINQIKKAWEDGRDGTKLVGSFPFIESHYINKTSQDYISKLKLDI